MDSDIQKRIQSKPELSVKPADLIVGGSFRVGLPGELDGTVKGTQFHIHRPAFHESAVVEDIAERQDIFLLLVPFAVYGLVQMSRVAFVGQRGEEGQIVLRVLCI